MPKRKADTSETSKSPTDVVRFVGLMKREDRARFRYFCDRAGQDMEQVAAAWVLDRLAEEERKLAKGR